jgi:hypothetical protein
MGQSINVESNPQNGVCLFTTDRSITSQDGAGFTSPEEAAESSGFPAALASRLFASDEAIDHVYVASNDVIVRRPEGWDSDSVAAAASTIGDLLRFYD